MACPVTQERTWTRHIEEIMLRQNPLLKRPPAGCPVLSWPASDLESGGAQPGDFCEKFGMVMQWTAGHRRGSELEKMRYVGDDLCEAVLEELDIRPSDDALEVFLAAADDDAVRNSHPACQRLKAQSTALPAWFDPASARRGQEFYIRHQAFFAKMLLHLGLVGGYGSSKINRVLSSTRYLIGEQDDTFRRLMETALCVTEFMDPDSLTPITGSGWKCAMRVRFLHGKVRRRLRASAKWNTEEWGVPINQEDLLGTLMAFSETMIQAARTIVGTSKQEEDDYFMLWRYVGYVLGILDEFNLKTVDEGGLFIESLFFHQINPDDSSRTLATHTLKSVENRTPEGWSLPVHQALARMLMGPSYAEQMGQPPVRFHHLLFHVMMFAGDALYGKVISRIPILGKWIVDANWEVAKRSVRHKLEGQHLSIYAQSKTVHDDNVDAFVSEVPRKTHNSQRKSEDSVQINTWFEFFAFHSIKTFLAVEHAVILFCIFLVVWRRRHSHRPLRSQ